MALTLVAAIGAKENEGNIQTFYNNRGGAKKEYLRLIATGKYRFMYMGNVINSWPNQD